MIAPILLPATKGTKTRVAVLFWRLGPYHHARLNAAGKVIEIIGVEACGMEDTYAWEKVEGAAAFERVTLTEQQVHDDDWNRELSERMRSALTRIKPKVVVVPGWSSIDALSALSWCAETRTRVVMMSETTAWDGLRVPWKEWIKRRLAKRCATALVGGTPHKDYMQRLGFAGPRIFLGYDAVDNDYFENGAAAAKEHQAEFRKRLRLPERFFLASARFVAKKNLARLVEAYARYRQMAGKLRASEAWDLVLLGDGPLRDSLMRQVSSLNLQKCVHLPGFKQYVDLPAYYGLASAFIHASTVEQWGLVVNEAMATGLGVLVSDRCGCAIDLVRSGVNGITFDPHSVEELSKRMRDFSSPGFDLAGMGRASKSIISEWGPGRFADGLTRAVNLAMTLPEPSFNALDRLLLNSLLKLRARANHAA
jgi:1,2-diacylglycerol 3-alpha-glucosyltransferase